MATVTSETDYVFKVTLTQKEVMNLKAWSICKGKRYADFVCDVIKYGLDKCVQLCKS